jgi:hypothetical protein
VEKKWHDLEIKAEFYLTESEISNGQYNNWESAFSRLLELKEKEPPPEFICGINKLVGLLQHSKGDKKAARISLLTAYRIARKSDLVCDSWQILSLYGSLWPGYKGPVEKRRRDLELQIFENLDEQIVGLIKARLKRWLNMDLARANSPVKEPSSVV